MDKKQNEKREKKQEDQIRVGLAFEKKILDQCDANIPLADCKSRSEYIRQAIQFYNFYLHTENDKDLLCQVMSDIVSATIKNTENRLARMHFKQAVELAKISHMLAPLCEMDKAQLDRLHNICVDEVSRINGVIIFDKLVEDYRKREQ